MAERNGRAPRLDHEVVMITGVSRGLGRELVRAFAEAGAAVAGCARSSRELQRLRDELEADDLSADLAEVDVTDADAMVRWADRVERELGAPSVLVSNASVLGPRQPLAEHPLEEWRSVLDVNLTGSFIAARAVLPSMLRRGRGSIIQLSSGAAVPPRRDWGAYSVSKLAADGLAQNLAAELEGTGIRVNIVDPGAMRTAMRGDAYPVEDPSTLQPPAARVPIFLWLASDLAAGVTGERFRAAEWKP